MTLLILSSLIRRGYKNGGREVRKSINIGLLVSVLIIVSTQFIFAKTPELFPGGAKVCEIFYQLSLAYIASYIFYVIVVFIPEKNSKKDIFQYVSKLVRMINIILGGISIGIIRDIPTIKKRK